MRGGGDIISMDEVSGPPQVQNSVNITRIILLKNNRVEIAYKVQNKHP